MTKWEYKRLTIEEYNQLEGEVRGLAHWFSIHGAEGWELFIANDERGAWYFRREIISAI
jgi:hypothetical protein